jgi:hypothetical protein
MRLLPAILVGFLLALASPAQGQTPDTAAPAVAAAQGAARAWLSLVDGARYGESWDSAASLFRRAITRSGWNEAVRKARGPFDPLRNRTLLSASFQTKLPNAPPGEYVVIQYQAQGGGGASAVEMITPMKEEDGRWRVAGYYIRPR